mmetsp:Transcript_9392/g.25331  ORF Transcript_9392/g.25331 Transcript_9392/m.25331 type:complete len:271 (-) Transcript_9392:68-880(-)
MLASLLRPLGAHMLQQVTQLHSSPVARAHSTGAPIEADRLLVHVLLLAPVSCAHHCDRDGHRGHRHDLVHGQGHGPLHQTIDLQPVLFPSDARGRTMVAYVVDGGRGDEACCHEVVHGGLTVQGVAACEAQDSRVSWDPGISSPLVLGIQVSGRDMQCPVWVLRAQGGLVGGTQHGVCKGGDSSRQSCTSAVLMAILMHAVPVGQHHTVAVGEGRHWLGWLPRGYLLDGGRHGVQRCSLCLPTCCFHYYCFSWPPSLAFALSLSDRTVYV